MSRIEILAKVIGLLLCVGFMIFPESNSSVQFALFGIILLSIGIPHGAIDHLISNPQIDKKGLGKFLVIYLSLIAVYLLLWYYLPVPALVAFLLMSAYHFGQSHFLTSPVPENNSLLLYVSRGGYFLFAILLGDWDATKQILSPLLNLEYLNEWRLPITGAFLIFTLLVQGVFGPKFSKNNLLELIILGPILYMSPLIISFVVYFGFWHAIRHTARLVPKLPSAMQKVSTDNPLASFFAAVVPGLYAILGIFLLGIFFVARGTTDLSSDFLWVILVIIWALTVPHMATTAKFDLRAFKSSLRP
jgi:Brp/Blh family beta-carotene 15,15'-monooxygenase